RKACLCELHFTGNNDPHPGDEGLPGEVQMAGALVFGKFCPGNLLPGYSAFIFHKEKSKPARPGLAAGKLDADIVECSRAIIITQFYRRYITGIVAGEVYICAITIIR